MAQKEDFRHSCLATDGQADNIEIGRSCCRLALLEVVKR